MRAEGHDRQAVTGLAIGITLLAIVAFMGTGAVAQEAPPSGALQAETPGQGTSHADQGGTDEAIAGASFLPAETVAYLELRGDLPAGQDEALGQVLARFPFMDQGSNVPSTMDGLLERFLTDATGGAVSWQEDLQPWLAGRASLGLLDIGSAVRGDPALLTGYEVTDPQRAAELAARIVEQNGGDIPGALVEEAHDGVSIVSGIDGGWAYAIVDDLLLVGTGTDEVRTGLDVVAGTAPALASVPKFRTALARVPEGRLAAAWVDVLAFRPLLQAASLMAADDSGIDLKAVLDALPLDVTGYLAARPDGAILQFFATPGEGTPSFGHAVPHLADLFPAGSQLYLEVPQLGTTILSVTDWLVSLLPTGLDDEAAVELLVSGLDNVLGWVGDGAIGGGMDDGRMWFGVVVEGASDGAADPYVGLLQAGLAAAALMPALDPTAPEAGFDLSVTEADGLESVTLSFDAADTGAQALVEPSISLARDGDRLLMGTSGWVAASLDPPPAASLAGDGRYQEALSAAGSPDAGHLFVDITAIREAIESILAFTTPEYAEIAPWLEPFDRAVVGYSVSDDGVLSTTLLVMLE